MFAAEMNYCGERGIPHSEFLDWEDEDRAKAIAWVAEQGTKCPNCGTADWEWERDPYAYEPVANICHGCEVKEYAREETANHAGVFVTLRPRR